MEQLTKKELLGKKREENWERKYRILCRFVEEYRCLPKSVEIYQGENIGTWFAYQKRVIKSENYPTKQKEKIENVIANNSSMYEKQWEDNFQLLCQFIDEFGYLPTDKMQYDGVNIGDWLKNHKQYSKNENYPATRIEKMEQILATTNTKHIKQWEENYHLLCEFVENHNYLPKSTEVYQGRNIGSWFSEQKKLCKKTDYPTECKEKIKSVLVNNKTVCEKRWEDNYQLLCQFIDEYGHLPKINDIYCECEIGRWWNIQKQNIKCGNPSECHKKKIEDIQANNTTADGKTWENNYRLLCRFIEEHNRLPKASEMYGTYNIGMWWRKQQQNIKRPSYPAERKKKIESLLRSTCSLPNKRWQDNYQLLCQFAEEHGRLPRGKECYSDHKIGQWFESQKKQCKQADYPEHRKQKIAQLVEKYETLHVDLF